VLSLVSAPLLHLGQRAVGFGPTSIQERAWLAQPEQGGLKGITRGAPVRFDVVVASRAPVTWVEKTDGVALATGGVTGKPGTVTQLTVSTSPARVREWISIWISGIKVPLKVWVSH
jgi:hypothetical protein